MNDLFAVHYAWLIPLLPLIGAIVAGFFGARFLKQQSHWPIWIGVGASALLSLSLLFGMLGLWGKVHDAPGSGSHDAELSTTVRWFDWITAGGSDTTNKSYANRTG